jgi:hypothetical protein
MGAEPGSVCGQKGTMKDVFARCLKRADVQVCTLIVYILFCNANPILATYGVCPDDIRKRSINKNSGS